MPEDLPHRLRRLSLPAKVVLYAALAFSTFVLAVVVGGLAAVAMGGDIALPGRNAPGPPGGRVEDTTLQGITSQDITSQDKSGADSQYAVPEGEGRARKEGASTGMPLWEALQGCEQSQETCARDFVARIAPAAEYVGGRIDTEGSGRTLHVLYFVDPARPPCEYGKFESPADASNVSYIVLIAGKGSFARRQQEESGAGCLPEL